MTFSAFNKLDREMAARDLFSCCGAARWVSMVMEDFPFTTARELVDKAGEVWFNRCGQADWLESFGHHPMIGANNMIKERFATDEQSGMGVASDEITGIMRRDNGDYENKFGFIFIVCATGLSAAEMLGLMQARMNNIREEEIRIAMGEQYKITLLRLKKLLTDANFKFLTMSQLTTHVLDTSMGKPGKMISVMLKEKAGDRWQTIAVGITGEDGRIGNLLAPGRILTPGIYKLVFETGKYFAANDVKGFYPEVEIQFQVDDGAHYHVPLLINPFGYSTYRGS